MQARSSLGRTSQTSHLCSSRGHDLSKVGPTTRGLDDAPVRISKWPPYGVSSDRCSAHMSGSLLSSRVASAAHPPIPSRTAFLIRALSAATRVGVLAPAWTDLHELSGVAVTPARIAPGCYRPVSGHDHQDRCVLRVAPVADQQAGLICPRRRRRCRWPSRGGRSGSGGAAWCTSGSLVPISGAPVGVYPRLHTLEELGQLPRVLGPEVRKRPG